MAGDLLTRGIPQTIIMFGINRLFTLLIRNRKPTARRNSLLILTEFEDLTHHSTTYLFQMGIIDARTNVHVNADQL